MRTPAFTFRRAVPVWEEGREREMNYHLAFVLPLPREADNPVLSLAASCSFVVAINGEFLAHGPARCAHGYYRVDQINLKKYMGAAGGTLSIRVAGYYARSFSQLQQPSFLCAEITDGERVLACTGTQAAEGEALFTAYRVTERVQTSPRYSYQRPFAEEYILPRDAFAYEAGKGNATPVVLAQGEEKNFLVRTQPYGDYPVVSPRGMVAQGVVEPCQPEQYYTDRALAGAGTISDGYPEDALTFHSYRDVAEMQFHRTASYFCRAAQTIDLPADGYVDIDLGCNYTGILDFQLDSPGGCELYILFDEFFGEDGSLDPFRMRTYNVLRYKFAGGSCHIHTCEPYCMRAVRLIVRCGTATIRAFKMFKIGFPMRFINASLVHGDEQLQAIFDAAVETFSANAADIFMDCPSRERAGWLGDSFFTARAEKVLTGASRLERTFLENFLLPERFPDLIPEGMLPMCYPSDFWEAPAYIPNYAMWYVLELEEYLGRTGDRELVDTARDRMMGVVRWFRQYENEYGLLEKLPGWIFVEWSHSNDLVQDVNFPTNMLYAAMKQALGRLYGEQALAAEGEALHQTIRKLSLMPNGFFCDNMLRRDGKLVLSGECTETCQYYAFFCRTATPQADPVLWERLLTDFGYDRAKTGKWPEIAPSNVIFGNYLRLDLLCREKLFDRLIEDIHGYFTYMAEKTGTLWENTDTHASCNHGMTSHVLVWLDAAGYVLHENGASGN